MVTILLQQILDLLTGWLESFTTWANDMGDKVAAIKTNTDNLPGIKADTADIKDNTAAVITPIGAINSNVSAIASDVGSIKADTTVIKNNAGSIATSSGAAAAFAENVANNTLNIDNRVVTIGSDTTQLRTNSNAMTSELHEIKQILQFYFLDNIVTEDSEGLICNFDTDLQDYLQKAIVNIPANANGISNLNIVNCGSNLWNESYDIGNINGTTGYNEVSYDNIRSVGYTQIKPNTDYYITVRAKIYFYDINKSYISMLNYEDPRIFTSLANAYYMRFVVTNNYGTTYNNDISINYPSADSTYHAYNGNKQSITFTSPITDGAEVDLLSGIVKINTSPVTYDSITPLAIRTFKGVNNIYSDIGDIDVTYRETLKHYLEKQEGN